MVEEEAVEAVEVEAEAVGGITSRCTVVGDAEGAGAGAGRIAEIPADMLATADQLRMLRCTRPMSPKSTLSLSVTIR